MERKKYLSIIILILISGFINAQSYKTIIYNAFVKGDMDKWKIQIDLMENKSNKENFLLDLIEYQYGYIAYLIGVDKTSEAERYLEKAYKNLDLYEDKNGNNSIVNSYKSAFIGFKIGISVYKAPFLGPKALDFGEESMKQGDNIPIVLMNYANMVFYMPKLYGGDKEKAIKYMLKAKSIMEKDQKEIRNNWLYLNLLSTIAQSYEEIGDLQKAEYFYKYALKKEPNFSHIKDELLPNLKNK